MATAKKAPAKKAPSKKAPAEKAPAKKDAGANIAADIVKRRNAGESVASIAAALGVNAVTVNAHYLAATVDPVKEAPTPTRIKAGRDKDGHSWKVLSLMYGITKGKVQELYREAGGDPKATSVAKAPAKEKAPKAPSKKAAGKKAAAEKVPAGDPVFGELASGTGALDAEAKAIVIERIDGKKITYVNSVSGGQAELRVKEGTAKVGHQKDGKRVVQFNDGDKTRTVALDAIVKVGR